MFLIAIKFELFKLSFYLYTVFESKDILLTKQWRHHDKNCPSSMVLEIFEIAKMNPEGFTIELPSLQPVTTGIVVGYKATQNSFDLKGLENCVQHAMENDQKIGGWLDTETGLFYFDSVKTFEDRNEAVDFGVAQEQIAVYDIDQQELIKL